MRLILASGSRYRRDMLTRLRLPFTCLSPDIDESPLKNEAPEALALRLAEEKAKKIISLHPDSIVIGSDQVATYSGHIIGKPGDHAAAVAQLQALSGQEVEFHSAICVMNATTTLRADVVTYCHFRQLRINEIEYYLHCDQAYDTAGSAKAESLGIALMQSMRSDDPTAIIGLPLITLCNMLRELGLDPLQSHLAH